MRNVFPFWVPPTTPTTGVGTDGAIERVSSRPAPSPTQRLAQAEPMYPTYGLIPPSRAEGLRLVYQDALITQALGNTPFHAPLPTDAQMDDRAYMLQDFYTILDVGCGTGRWAQRMAERYPHAQVVAIEAAPPTAWGVGDGSEGMPRYHFYQGEFLRPGEGGGLRELRDWGADTQPDGEVAQRPLSMDMPDHAVDFTHIWHGMTRVPTDEWQDLLREALRVTRPGGWIEVGDLVLPTSPVSRLADLILEISAAYADQHIVYTAEVSYDALLTRWQAQGQITAVTTKTTLLPYGATVAMRPEWITRYGERDAKRLGQMTQRNFEQFVQHLRPALIAHARRVATVRSADTQHKRQVQHLADQIAWLATEQERAPRQVPLASAQGGVDDASPLRSPFSSPVVSHTPERLLMDLALCALDVERYARWGDLTTQAFVTTTFQKCATGSSQDSQERERP